eukprot:TRINITY_DN9001_c0_g2_i3.p1 TRINITY_DN9001_c0_g2~~TRINITY_DN9001_c0_g2_i3.p1  ORF type:complete len:259 (-),score=43.99 TRINITY_DN9001_c0_g2_i3:63-839(-)
MDFLVRLFTPAPKLKASHTPVPASLESPAPPSPAYAGPIVGLFASDRLCGAPLQVILELDSQAALSAVPAALVCPSDPLGRVQFGRESSTEVAPGVKARGFVSAGRSLYRPQWFADLALCGAYIFMLENIEHGSMHPPVWWYLRNWTVPGAPILFVISTPPRAGGKRLFKHTPTLDELAAKFQLEPGVLEGHPVQIVACCYNVPKGKGREKAEMTPPAEFTAALAWLQTHLVADSWAAAMARRGEREAGEAERTATSA